MISTRRGEGSFTARAFGWIGPAVLVVAAAATLTLGHQGAEVGDDTFRVYRDADFEGKEQVVHPVTRERPARLHELNKKLRDKVRSMEWNLPRGVVVVFYDHTNGTGRQFPIWGSDRRGSLADADYEKRAGAWAWFYVDGWEEAPSQIRAGFAVRPLMTKESSEQSAEDTLDLHKDAGARSKGKKLYAIESVTSRPQGTVQPVEESLDSKVSSLRWNLPPGIIVILYENADGSGRRLPLWGDGEIDSLRSMNDRISAWAWYDAAAGPAN